MGKGWFITPFNISIYEVEMYMKKEKCREIFFWEIF